MTQPLLSICIPNYNRADFLTKNLAVIGKQLNPQVQVVVSDDDSAENIDTIIKNFKKKYPHANLKYQRQKKNLGFDRNVLKVVELADGEYCWLLSNDDKILPGSLKKILNLIHHKRPALLLVNYKRFDQRLKQTTSTRMVNLRKDHSFDNANEFYFLLTPSSYFKILGINTLTMSCDIFRRVFWFKAASQIKRFIGHNFIHVFALVTMINDHPSIYFLAQPQVQYLANNHRFWPNLIWKDYRHILLRHMSKIGYNQVELRKLKAKLKQDEINERLWTTGQRIGLYQRFFPYIRKIRNLFGHHI